LGNELARCVGLSEATMDKTFDLNIRPLVAVIKAFEGLPSSADVLVTPTRGPISGSKTPGM
jgi:hypothetical protein